MKVYDCFLFNDEIELLELRLMELYELVDVFVLVESDYNWQQKKKPLFYEDNKSKFKDWADKIRHVVVTDTPIGKFPLMENFQRRQIVRGLHDVSWQDIIFFGDSDEIANPLIVDLVRKYPPPEPFACHQFLYTYYVNMRQMSMWNGTMCFCRTDYALDFQSIRDSRNNIKRLFPGGWHFSWLGPREKIQYKLSCHTPAEDAKRYGGKTIDVPDPDNVVRIDAALDSGLDLFGRDSEGTKREIVPIGPGQEHPGSITEWLKKHPQFLRKEVQDATVSLTDIR